MMWPHTETGETLVLDGQPLEHTVYRADSLLSQAVGVMGRFGVPDGAALVFPFDRPQRGSVHMLGVRRPIRAWWVREQVLVKTSVLAAWTGFGSARVDCVIELPASAPTGTVGQTVVIR